MQQAFETLSYAPRRRIIRALDDRNARTVDEFVSRAIFPDHDDSKKAHIDFHHRHLPSLDRAGVIDWDRENSLVTRGEQFDEIAPLLKVIDEHRDELPDHWV